MLVPDVPHDRPLQFIDMRDLATWMIHLLETGERGPFNGSGPVGGAPVDWRALIAAYTAEVASRGMPPAEAVDVGEAFLLQHGLQPWSDLQLWLPSTNPAYAGFHRDLSRAPLPTSAPGAGLRARIKALATGGPTGLHGFCSAMKKRDPKPAPPATDRRAGADRRLVDVPLPAGERDRRRTLEARKPDVIEIDMSQSERAALSELSAPPARPETPTK